MNLDHMTGEVLDHDDPVEFFVCFKGHSSIKHVKDGKVEIEVTFVLSAHRSKVTKLSEPVMELVSWAPGERLKLTVTQQPDQLRMNV